MSLRMTPSTRRVLAGMSGATLLTALHEGAPPRAHKVKNRVLTVLWYAAGGAGAAAVFRASRQRVA